LGKQIPSSVVVFLEKIVGVLVADAECCPGHGSVPFDHQRIPAPPPSVHKASASIDVIGSAVRDTRRQQMEFRDSVERDLYATAYLC